VWRVQIEMWRERRLTLGNPQNRYRRLAAMLIHAVPDYPFNPVVAIPSTRYFCRVMNMITTGSMDRVDMANMAP